MSREIDYTKLEKLRYRGYDTAEAKAAKDRAMQQGFIPVDPKETPFGNDERAEEAAQSPQPTQHKQARTLKSVDGARDYRELYAALYRFHAAHWPPGADLEYWEQMAEDIQAECGRFKGDRYAVALFAALYDEFERENATINSLKA